LHTVTLAIEIKIQANAVDLDTWKRIKKILDYLQSIGMSSEEEDEVEYQGHPLRIYKVKISIWRAPEIADYMRMVDVQTEVFRKQKSSGGTQAAVRVPTDQVSTSAAPQRLPKCLYNSKWIEKLTSFEYEDLEVSADAFSVLIAATNRMMQ
jgi:hypothetical protein